MPHFYFDSMVGDEAFTDDVGSEMADEATAQREAEKALGEMTADNFAHGQPRVAQIWIRDDRGRLLLHLVSSLVVYRAPRTND